MLNDEFYRLNFNCKFSIRLIPNLVLQVTFQNDGYDHYGLALRVNWQGKRTVPSICLLIMLPPPGC